MTDHVAGGGKWRTWKMADLCGLEFEGLENARPGKYKTELGHFSRRRTTATNA